MTSRFQSGLAGAALALGLAAWSRPAAAQSAGQLGAWDALMLSPIGALAPVAGDSREIANGADVLMLRYGRWRYDAEDAVHDNVGLAWSHTLGFAKTRLTLTGAYGMVECPECSSLMIGGLDLQSTLASHDFPASSSRAVSTSVGLRLSVGGGREIASAATSAASAAVALPIDIAVPFRKTSRLCASITPGFAFGRTAGVDLAESGFLPTLGAAISWTATPSIGVNFGVQRIIITGGPMQIGGALSLKLGRGSESRP